NTVVALACGQGRLTDAALDGHTPVIKGGEADGFFVEVRTPGEHQLTLDLEVAVATRGNTSGFVLDLPRAPATRLELELPAGVKDVRVGNRPVAEVPLLTLIGKGQQLKGLPPSTSGPGIPDKLD